MPGKIKTRIICARNLPIMDRSSDSCDAFVEIRFGNDHYDKTHVCKRSLDPTWNSRFVFEVEEDEIQEEPLQIRVLDHDTYSSHDAIGKVYIDLKPLLNKDGPSSISGWFPIYDTMHGIRGEINVQAKIEIFSDFNEYRKSSCGVQFFCSSKIPENYLLQNFCGFVEELVINDDPEYQWIDKIRTPRTSNETRQKLFSKLSGEVQRRIGLKAREINANSVLGYMQSFDLEGEHGVVVRGIGTMANIYKINSNLSNPLYVNTMTQNLVITLPISPQSAGVQVNSKLPFFNNPINYSMNQAVTNHVSTVKDEKIESNDKFNKKININQQFHNITNNLNANNFGDNQLKPNKYSPNRNLIRIHSDSDLNAYQNYHSNPITDNPFQVNQKSNFKKVTLNQLQQQNTNQNNEKTIFEKIEYPFLTIQQYPVGFVKSICGIVCARSVKLLSSTSAEDDLDERDKWWIEIRNEIRSHMKALNCHVVLGYNETKSICEDICVLSASGTAAVIDEAYFNNQTQFNFDNSIVSTKNCKLCHIPYNENDLPFPVTLSTCSICGIGLVPDIIFSSVQPLPEIEIKGQGCLLRAIVTRPRKKASGELSAKMISNYLPFMEYELHRQLLGKLKLKGMNMLYGLRIQISIGENLLTGLAEATACFAAPLPEPVMPKIMDEKSDKTAKEFEEIEKLSKLFKEEMNRNKDYFNLNSFQNTNSNFISNQIDAKLTNETEFSQAQQIGNLIDSKTLFKIDLDDVREKEEIYLLLDASINSKKGRFYACSTEIMPGISKFDENIQMFTSVYRCERSLVQMNTPKFNEICDEILRSLQYKFRKYSNYCLSNLSFDTSLYDDDHAMIIITGCCLTFTDNKESKLKKDDTNGITEILKKQDSKKENNRVEITSLSYVPNAQITNYLGHVNLFLIRESTQIKENGGLSGFMHCFIGEVLALSRAHVLSLGGNALVSFKMNECVLLDNPHRNQGQCLVNVSGDAVKFIST